MTQSPHRPFVPALLAALLAAIPAMAQAPAPATPPAPATSPVPATGPATGSAAAPRSIPVVERRIADLHARLKITPSEEGPFRDFATVMRDNADRMATLTQAHRKAATTMTAIDHMQSYGQVAQAHAEDMQRLIPAFSRLYDVLSPAQKKLADSSFQQFTTGQVRPG